MSNFDAEYFDREFYVCETQTKGGKRDVEIPVFEYYVSLMLKNFGGKNYRFLDIGCGVGLRTMHYVNNGENASGFDVSEYANKNSVLPEERRFKGDVRELSKYFNKNSFDVINCERTICYLPPEDAELTIEELKKVASKYIVFTIICKDHVDPNVPVTGRYGRLNINTKAYWEDLFAKHNLEIDDEKTQVMRPPGWDCIWVVKVKNEKNFSKEQMAEINSAQYSRNIDIDSIDMRVKGLSDFFPALNGKKILEIGSLDGYHACNLSSFGAKVTCSDIRPQNLQASLYRCLYYGYKDVTYRLLDMETMHMEIEKDEYDIIFHSGCFYHLVNPVKHLFNIAELSRWLLLETHIASDKYPPGTLEYNGEIYDGTLYPDGGWTETQASKSSEITNSFWLTKESLLKLFDNCNLKIVKTISDNMENPHGTRVCYLLFRGGDIL